MISIGKYNRMQVVEKNGRQVYLANGKSQRVLLADTKHNRPCRLGETLEVFVYVDADGHLSATEIRPAGQVGDFAWLKVVSVNYYGAFLDWGLPKDLLVPFNEQNQEMKAGRYYLVKIILDGKNRVLGTTKFNDTISDDGGEYVEGQKVSLIIADKTDLGFKAIVNRSHWGILYYNELFREIDVGQQMEGYIKRVRSDNKLDLTLHMTGYGKVESLAATILERLSINNGFLPLTDHSPPEAIHAAFGVSKKTFKQALGMLYKRHRIALDHGGIRLL